MDLHMLEYAAEIVFRMCREHPEICPHDYSWYKTTPSDEDGKRLKHYKCGICRHELIEEVFEN